MQAAAIQMLLCCRLDGRLLTITKSMEHVADDPHSENSPAAADLSALFLYSRPMFHSDRVGVTKGDLTCKRFP